MPNTTVQDILEHSSFFLSKNQRIKFDVQNGNNLYYYTSEKIFHQYSCTYSQDFCKTTHLGKCSQIHYFLKFRLNFFSIFDGFNLNFPHEERLFIAMPFRTERKRKICQQGGSGIIRQLGRLIQVRKLSCSNDSDCLACPIKQAFFCGVH